MIPTRPTLALVLFATLLPSVLTCLTGRMAGAAGAPARPAEARDPEKLFQKACARLVALEPRRDLLAGVSRVKPVIERDDKKRLKSASLIFEQNAVPPGKGPAKPKDKSRPFIYVSIQVWSGRSLQPPGDLYEFAWKGQTYQMWVRVFSSSAELIKTIRKAVDVQGAEPPPLILHLGTSQTLRAYRKGHALVFEGVATSPIHRPGPEHFKLTRVADSQRVPLRVAYDRDKVERQLPGKERVVEAMKSVYVYNSLFKGTRLFLYEGSYNDKDTAEKAGILQLYGCPKLEAGVRYRLTWVCWPVGASEAVEVSCEFELDR